MMENTSHAEMIHQIALNGYLLLADLNYKQEMKILHISFFQFLKRKKFTQEFQSLDLALWRLALSRSFPHDCQKIFYAFLELDWPFEIHSRQYVLAHGEVFYEKLQAKGVEDFTEIARHFLSLTDFDSSQTKGHILRIALHIRTKYYYFFNNLVKD